MKVLTKEVSLSLPRASKYIILQQAPILDLNLKGKCSQEIIRLIRALKLAQSPNHSLRPMK